MDSIKMATVARITMSLASSLRFLISTTKRYINSDNQRSATTRAMEEPSLIQARITACGRMLSRRTRSRQIWVVWGKRLIRLILMKKMSLASRYNCRPLRTIRRPWTHQDTMPPKITISSNHCIRRTTIWRFLQRFTSRTRSVVILGRPRLTSCRCGDRITWVLAVSQTGITRKIRRQRQPHSTQMPT